MIAQIVQKLFGPMPGASEGALAPLQAVSANPHNADFSAEMDVSASLPNAASVASLQQSKILTQDSQLLEADEALLAGLIAAQGNLFAPTPARNPHQGEVALAMSGAAPSALIMFDSAKSLIPDAAQGADVIAKTPVLAELGIEQAAGPQTESLPQLASAAAASGDLAPVFGPQAGASISNVIPAAQLGADMQALGRDAQAILSSKGTSNNVDQENSTHVPRAKLPVFNGVTQPLAGDDLAVLASVASAQPMRIATTALAPSHGAGVTSAANIPPPSPVQMSLQASFIQVQAVRTDTAIKPVQIAVNDSALDDSEVPNSDLLVSFLGAARIDTTMTVPVTPSQNVINFNNSQSELVAALGAEELALGSLTEGSSPLGPMGEGRSGGGASIGATAPMASSASFAAANMPSAALSAQILPLAREAQNGGVDLTLSPVELGQLRFEMRQVGDQMQILLSAERPETLDLLRRHIDALRSDFAEAGFAGASLSFGSWGQGREQSPPPQFLPEYQEITAQSAPMPNVMSAPSPIWPQKQDAGRGLNLRL